MMSGADPATRESPLTANDECPAQGGPRGRGRPKGSKNRPKPLVPATSDSPVTANDERSGEGGAVTPRRRGRPKGSKNKAKALVPRLFEIPSGEDMRMTLETFTLGRQLGLFILSGNGMVRNVTLHNLADPTAVVTYGGPLHILSISGAFPRTTENQQATEITVSLKDVRTGAIVAGTVMDSLLAFGRVFLMAGTVADIHQEQLNVQPAQV